EVDEGLLELGGVEGGAGVGEGAVDAEVDLAAQAIEEIGPGGGLGARGGELGEAGVALDELLEVVGAVGDGGEDLVERVVLAAAEELGARVGEGGDRGEGVVELVADDADDLFPGADFLAVELGGEVAQDEELVGAAVEAKARAREVVDLLVVIARDGEQAVAAAGDGVAQGLGGGLEEDGEEGALEAAAGGEELAGGEVAVDDVAARVAEEHRDRGVLDHGVEEELAVDEGFALAAEGVAEGVVRGDEVAELVVALPGQAEREVAVAVG